ncbi:MAG: transglutaminase family protein [Ornithinimicrobium sp.]
MQRTVTARITASINSTAEIAVSVVAAASARREQEELSVRVSERELHGQEVAGSGEARWQLFTDVPVGDFVLEYRAVLTSGGAATTLSPGERISYLRPSRYADVDRLGNTARALFGHYGGPGSDLQEGQDVALLGAVRDYVAEQTAYVIGSSRVTDGASDTFLARRGVCRDFGHLTIALLRARGIPARLVSAYAPGLLPMDFHAVVEAWVAGGWHVVDPTRLAPRRSLVRIATGTDAAETAFLTTHSGELRFGTLTVTATTDGPLPDDDHAGLAQIA